MKRHHRTIRQQKQNELSKEGLQQKHSLGTWRGFLPWKYQILRHNQRDKQSNI